VRWLAIRPRLPGSPFLANFRAADDPPAIDYSGENTAVTDRHLTLRPERSHLSFFRATVRVICMSAVSSIESRSFRSLDLAASLIRFTSSMIFVSLNSSVGSGLDACCRQARLSVLVTIASDMPTFGTNSAAQVAKRAEGRNPLVSAVGASLRSLAPTRPLPLYAADARINRRLFHSCPRAIIRSTRIARRLGHSTQAMRRG
jgi:hypothetical protein